MIGLFIVFIPLLAALFGLWWLGSTHLPEKWQYLLLGVVIGMYAKHSLDLWDNRIRQRDGADRRGG